MEQATYYFIHSLSHLKNANYLSPLWLELKNNIEKKFRESDANKGWAWKLTESDDLLETWNFNMKAPDDRHKMMHQLDLAEDELDRIFSLLDPPSNEMLQELEETISLIKKDIIKKLEDY